MVGMAAHEVEELRLKCDETQTAAAEERRKLVGTTAAQLQELQDKMLNQSTIQIKELQGLLELRDRQLSQVVSPLLDTPCHTTPPCAGSCHSMPYHATLCRAVP